MDTHTHTDTRPLRGALSQNLSRYLKSPRSERKKDRKSKTKRGREKDNYLALDYLALDSSPRGRETCLKSHLTSLKENLENEESNVHVCVHACV